MDKVGEASKSWHKSSQVLARGRPSTVMRSCSGMLVGGPVLGHLVLEGEELLVPSGR